MSQVPHAEGPGTVLGNYRLLETIGEGGFGVVYKAEQKEPVQREVALKLIKLGMDTRQVVARFQAERQALALMDHPSIARVYDAGATETGRPYFVMELVGGEHLTDYCDRKKLGTNERLELFRDVCLAMQHAHQKGILHRDLKPSNVLVTEVDGAPVPKVIDFGIAKAMERPLTDSTLATEQFQVMGTPDYMSPEQAEGRDVDTRADVYALGAILYELLTGALPVQITTESYDIMEMLRQIRHVTPAKPSTRVGGMGDDITTVAAARGEVPSALVRHLRGDLDWIVMKALEKDRERRYATAIELAEDVARHLRDEPVLASPPSTAYRLSKFVRRNRILVGASAAVLLAGVGSVGVLGWSFVRVREERDAASVAQQKEADARTVAETALVDAQAAQKAEAQARLGESEARVAAEEALEDAIAAREAESKARERAEASLAEANTVTEFLIEMTSTAEPWVGGRDILMRDALMLAAPTVATRFEDQPRAHARIARAMSTSLMALGVVEEADKQAFDAVAVARRELDPDDAALEDALFQAGMIRSDSERYGDAEELFLEALEVHRRRGGEADREAKLRNVLGLNYRRAGRYAEAEEELLRSVEIAERIEDAEVLWFCKINLAAYYDATGRNAERDRLTQEVYEWHLRVDGPEHPETLRARRHRVEGDFFSGRPEEDVAEREDLLAVSRRVFGDRHPDTIECMEILAQAYRELTRFDEASALLEEARAALVEVFGEDHSSVGIVEKNHAVALWRGGSPDQAEPLIEHAVETLTRELGEAHPETMNAGNVAGIIHHQLGKYEQALSEWETVYERTVLVEGAESEAALALLQNIAMVQTDLGRLVEAEENYLAVLETAERRWGRETRLWNNTLNNLAINYMSAGRLDESAELNEQLVEIRTRQLGREHPDTLGNIGNLSQIYRVQGRLEEALEYSERSLEARERVLGPDHPSTARSFFNRGECLSALGREVEAEEMLRLSCETFLRAEGRLSGSGIMAHKALADLLVRTEQREEAESMLPDVLAASREAFGMDHITTLEIASTLGRLYVEGDHPDEGRELLESTLQAQRMAAEGPDATPAAQRSYADNLLTCPLEDLRDSATALEFARAADEGTYRGLPDYRRTLALALAANGEADEAREVALDALDQYSEDAVARAELLPLVR